MVFNIAVTDSCDSLLMRQKYISKRGGNYNRERHERNEQDMQANHKRPAGLLPYTDALVKRGVNVKTNHNMHMIKAVYSTQ